MNQPQTRLPFRWRVAHLIERADRLCHRLGWCPGWLCLAADVSYGWGPTASDWDRSATWLHRWLHGWLYGDCAAVRVVGKPE